MGVEAGEGLGCVWEPLWGKQELSASSSPTLRVSLELPQQE